MKRKINNKKARIDAYEIITKISLVKKILVIDERDYKADRAMAVRRREAAAYKELAEE